MTSVVVIFSFGMFVVVETFSVVVFPLVVACFVVVVNVSVVACSVVRTGSSSTTASDWLIEAGLKTLLETACCWTAADDVACN